MPTTETIAPPSAPLMTQAPTTDDIADPPVPPEVLAPTVPVLPDAFVPLAHGFLQYLQNRMVAILNDESLRIARGVEVILCAMKDHVQGVLTANEHAAYQLSDALHKLREEGIKVTGAPYEMQLHVCTPAGLPLTLTIRQSTPTLLLDELTRLETWLQGNGYTAPVREEVA